MVNRINLLSIITFELNKQNIKFLPKKTLITKDNLLISKCLSVKTIVLTFLKRHIIFKCSKTVDGGGASHVFIVDSHARMHDIWQVRCAHVQLIGFENPNNSFARIPSLYPSWPSYLLLSNCLYVNQA